MKSKALILSTLVVALFAISSGVQAGGKGGGGGYGGGKGGYGGCHGDRGGSSISGDNTRERAGGPDRGRGELNRDNDTQSAENASAAQRSSGTRVSDIARGQPRDPGYSFNRTKEETMGHD